MTVKVTRLPVIVGAGLAGAAIGVVADCASEAGRAGATGRVVGRFRSAARRGRRAARRRMLHAVAPSQVSATAR